MAERRQSHDDLLDEEAVIRIQFGFTLKPGVTTFQGS